MNPFPCAKSPDDQVVSSTTGNPSLRDRCFRVLSNASSTHGILPKSYFPPRVTLSDSTYYSSGGFADVWKGQLDGKQVCVKALRIQMLGGLDRIKRVCYSSLF